MPSRDLEQLMWAEACEMLDRAERLQRQFFQPGQGRRLPAWEPPVDIHETAERLWLVVAMPGASADSIEVSVESADLVVRAQRDPPRFARAGRMHRLEIPQGRFERRLRLPRGSYRLVEREWRDGCLYLGLSVGGAGGSV